MRNHCQDPQFGLIIGSKGANMSCLKNKIKEARLTDTVCVPLVLSISMTACSSILAMGMMPLCLLIYTTLWTANGAIQIPYDSISEYTTNGRLLAHYVKQHMPIRIVD